MLIARGLSTLPIKGKPVFSSGPRSLHRNPPDCPILCNCVFDNFVLADELFAKALVINNLCRKLVSLLELLITFHEIFKGTSVLFFIPDFNLLSCKLGNFTFKVLY